MYLLHEEPEEFADLAKKWGTLGQQLAEQLEPTAVDVKFPTESDIFQEEGARGSLALLKEGILQYSIGNRVQFIAEEGNLIGVEQHFFPESAGSYISDFAVVVDCYDVRSVVEQVGSNADLAALWSQFLVAQITLSQIISASFQKEDVKFNPRILNFNTGEMIIEQGSEGNDVYTLAEGTADVFVDNVKVGEVLADEMFGALAALTQTPRTATVIAQSQCLVLALPEDKFTDLFKSRPSTVKKLVDDMARKLVSLNQRVISLAGEED